MPDVQVAIGFRWKTGMDGWVLAAGKVCFHDFFQKMQ
jgi:hypothetical protein